MTYPNTILSKFVRRLIMVVFVFIFSITAPVIVLYTNGYRYDLHKNSIIKTGVISIDILPNDATVYVGGEKIKEKLPIRIPGKLPGVYSVVVEREDYQSTQYDLVVKENQASYLRGVTLLKNPSIEKIAIPDNQIILRAIPSNTGKYYLTIHGKTNGIGFDAYLYEIKNNTFHLVKENIPKVPDILWSRNSDNVALSYTDKKSKEIIVINAHTPTKLINHSVQQGLSDRIIWQELRTGAKLFGRVGDKILDLSTPELRTYSPVSTSIWYVDNNGDLWEGEPKRTTIINRTNPHDSIISGPGVQRIIDMNNRRIIIEKDSGLVIMDRGGAWSRQIIAREGFNIRFNPKKNEWFAILPSEIWLIESDGRTWPINRFAAKVQDVTRLNTHSLVVYATIDRLATFHEAYYINNNLYNGVDIGNITTSEDTSSVYFTDRVDGQLEMIRIDL
jgi:hypothetical protein